jgi:hypothetical protein
LRIAPEADDKLLWAINERSYITRNLLRYALIIRRSWPERIVLRQTFPRLSHYSLFREALPFLKGDRCGISEDEYRGIVGFERSEHTRHGAVLQSLKAEKIGRGHKKGQAVSKMSQLAETAGDAIRRLFEIAASDSAETRKLREETGPDALLTLSQWCMALAEDAQLRAEDLNHRALPEPLAALADNLLIVSRANRDERAGFRKALGSLALMKAADVLNALRSDERLER